MSQITPRDNKEPCVWGAPNSNKTSLSSVPYHVLLLLLGVLLFGIIVQLCPHDNSSSLSQSDEPWTNDKFFDISNFKWIQNNHSICNLREYPQDNIILMLINSKWNNFQERETIRRTWGIFATTRKLPFQHWSLRYVFLLLEEETVIKNGPSSSVDGEWEVHEESSNFGDIIIGNLIDSQTNLTLKHLMGYKWALNHCQNASLVVTTDDNVFQDIPQWVVMNNEEIKNGQINYVYCIPILTEATATTNETNARKEKNSTGFIKCSGWTFGVRIPFMKMIYKECVRLGCPISRDNDEDLTLISSFLPKRNSSDLNLNHQLAIKVLNQSVRNTPSILENIKKNNCSRRNAKNSNFSMISLGPSISLKGVNDWQKDMNCLWNNSFS